MVFGVCVCVCVCVCIHSQAARDVVLRKFPDSDEMHRRFEGRDLEIFVRITDLPLQDRLRELRYAHVHVCAVLCIWYAHGTLYTFVGVYADKCVCMCVCVL